MNIGAGIGSFLNQSAGRICPKDVYTNRLNSDKRVLSFFRGPILALATME